MPFATNQILWYNNGAWGRLGYAVPNIGKTPVSVNEGIRYLARVMGRNLAGLMQSPDCNISRPPTINTLTRIHKLITRARTIMSGRQVPPGVGAMEAVHATPAPEDHVIFPVPYFLVRNAWIKEYCGLVLSAISECMQHTDNGQSFDFGLDFAGTIGQYLHRIYRLMGTELFLVPLADASKPDFALSEAQLAAYDPAKWLASTEMIDTLPPLADLPAAQDLEVLMAGIPATQLVGATPWPAGSIAGGTSQTGAPGPTSTGAFAPAPTA